MLYKDVRGSPIYEPQSVSTFSGLPHTQPMHVGFRLVHDNADRVISGGCWDSVQRLASVSDTESVLPQTSSNYLGFRITRGTP